MEELRKEIDSLDSELLGLLNRRAALAQEVADSKRRDGGSFYRPERERELIERLQSENPGPFPGVAIRPVFQEIVSACLSLEESMQVAYLGPEATFTHQAVKRHFGSSARAVPCGSIGAVFAEVERGASRFGVVPVENSSEGIVNHTLDSFVDSELQVVAEIVVGVEHCLLARPGLSESRIERVYSHPQALAQCRAWVGQNLPRARLVPSASTADAARAAMDDSEGAALASELAARIYGLQVLRQRVQDMEDNLTRFLVVGPSEAGERPGGANQKTSLLLSLPDSPGALLEVLTCVSERGINLSKIESRPSRKRAWDYVFFLDLDGDLSDPAVAEVVAALKGRCDLCKVLGSYNKADVHE